MKSEYRTNAQGDTEHYIDGELRATISGQHLDEYKTGRGDLEEKPADPLQVYTASPLHISGTAAPAL